MPKWEEYGERERDALIAVEVMNYHVRRKNGLWEYLRETLPTGQIWIELPHFSTDISAAWEVVEKMKIIIVPQTEDAPKEMSYMAEKHGFKFDGRDTFRVFAPTAPEAICKVALRALGADV